MSIKIINSILCDQTPTFTANEKLLLICFAKFADDSGEKVWPSISRLIGMSGLSRRTVIYVIKSLCNKGALILCEFYASNPHIRMSNVYKINVDLIESLKTSPEIRKPKTKPKRVVDNLLIDEENGVFEDSAPVHHLHPPPCTICTPTIIRTINNRFINVMGVKDPVDNSILLNDEVAHKPTQEEFKEAIKILINGHESVKLMDEAYKTVIAYKKENEIEDDELISDRIAA